MWQGSWGIPYLHNILKQLWWGIWYITGGTFQKSVTELAWFRFRGQKSTVSVVNSVCTEQLRNSYCWGRASISIDVGGAWWSTWGKSGCFPGVCGNYSYTYQASDTSTWPNAWNSAQERNSALWQDICASKKAKWPSAGTGMCLYSLIVH